MEQCIGDINTRLASIGTTLAFTENLDKALNTSGSKCLDFFVRIVRNADLNDYIKSFCEAWSEDKETAVKILMNLRDVRKGKGEKLIPIVLLVYLRHSLPAAIYEELARKMIEYGYWKDVLRVLEIYNRFLLEKNKKTVIPLKPFEIKLFAEQLKNDLGLLTASSTASANNSANDSANDSEKATKKIGISLCAKWSPSENTHFDHHPLFFAKNIAKAMKVDMKTYRQTISKLRKHINVLERLMATQQFDLIDFSKLPSVAMMKMKRAFNRDVNAEGKESDARKKLHISYTEYLKKLAEGKTKINITGIQPHELVNTYYHKESDVEIDGQVEAQWKELAKRVKVSGAFNKVTAICDVSGSMDGTPMLVSIALGILVAECTMPPFNNKIMTFNETPSWHHLEGTTLKEKVTSLSTAEWGSSTNMRAALDLLLTDAINANLTAEQMVDTLFIFTDMQFDSVVCANHSWGEQAKPQPVWESTFEEMKRAYEAAGYKFPNIICWNLRTSCAKTVPVSKNEKGFVMLSGFSAELLKCILDAEEFSPLAMMKHILEPYTVPESITNYNLNLAYMDDQELKQLSSAVLKSNIKKKYKHETVTDISEQVMELALIKLLDEAVVISPGGDEIITVQEIINFQSGQMSDTDTSSSSSSSESD